jgi:hypothetical protein
MAAHFAGGFDLHRRPTHRGQLSGHRPPGEVVGIFAIGLDPI